MWLWMLMRTSVLGLVLAVSIHCQFGAVCADNLAAEVAVVIPSPAQRPRIIDTTPDDGANVTSGGPFLTCTWDRDMDTSRTNVTKVFVPDGMIVTAVVWLNVRTMEIRYSGSMD